MRPRALLVGLLLVSVALAGCLDGGDGAQTAPEPPDQGPGSEDDGTDEPPPPQDDGPSVPPPFLLQGKGCLEAGLTVPIERATAQAQVPDGFTPVPYNRTQGLPAGDGQAALVVQTLACEEGGLGSASGGFLLHVLAIPVTPPASLTTAAALDDRYLVAAVTDEPTVAMAFDQRGWAVAEGQVSLEHTASPLGGGTVGSTATGANISSQIDAVIEGTNRTLTSGFLRLWHDPGQRLEYLHQAITTTRDAANATGTVRSDDQGSLTAELSGQANTGTGQLVGPFDLLATPTIVRAM